MALPLSINISNVSTAPSVLSMRILSTVNFPVLSSFFEDKRTDVVPTADCLSSSVAGNFVSALIIGPNSPISLINWMACCRLKSGRTTVVAMSSTACICQSSAPFANSVFVIEVSYSSAGFFPVFDRPATVLTCLR